MPITTDLNVSPYFDDFNPLKDYYKVLFKPGVAVQTRELNQLQTYFQNQIERFGDNIFSKGSIIEGCTFTFNNAQAYAKILDDEADGVVAVPSLYRGKFVRNSANLRAYVVNSSDGFEATEPDLKTLYFNYINAGNTGNLTAFSPGEVLTVFDPVESVYKVTVNTGGISFSNTDPVIFVSQVSVNVTSGTFTVGDNIIDTTPGSISNLEIVSIDTTTLSNFGHILLTLKPNVSDLANAASNSSNWTLFSDTEVRNISNTAVGTVQRVFGTGATARITTSGAGTVLSINVLTRGEGYVYAPYATIKSPDNSTGINALDITAKNFVGQVTIAANGDSVGNGYTFGVSEGIIYQKGHFLRVNPQYIVVEKYSSTPNALAVGFVTEEFIVNSNVDTSLLDNALGTENYTAPGADRLQLIPRLEILSKDDAAADENFFTIVEWNDGNPYKQNQLTQYSRIGEEIARHTFDSSGSFVIDDFQVTTESTSNSLNEGLFYGLAIDPGQAYIGGQRVQTTSNYKIDVKKGIDTELSNNIITLNYGNYLKVKEVGGNFLFSVGANVDFYDTSKGFLSNTALISAGNTAPVGSKIGTAKIRSMMLESDYPGQANSIYRMYLFDIQMTSGNNFRDVKSIFFDGTSSSTANGVADVLLENDSTTGRAIAKLRGTEFNGLIFASGVNSIKNSNNTNYVYRTIDSAVATSNTGVIVKDISTVNGEVFEEIGNLTTFDLRKFYIAPVANNLIQASNLTGTVSINTTSTTVTGSGTDFFSDFIEGDFAQFSNGSVTEIKRIVTINSSVSLTVDSVFGMTDASATFKRAFPKNVAVPFGYREGLTGNVNSNGNVLTLSFGHSNGDSISFEGSVTVNTAVGYNVRRENVTSTTKTANRNQFVKIRIANNTGQILGPWCVGIPDIFRLRNVYVANTSSVNTASPNVVDSFYIDHNQNANYLGLGYLYLNPASGLSITTDDYLLVEFDYFTNDGSGYFDAKSYRRTADANNIATNDSLPLSNLTNFAHSLEIPEVYTFDGQYYDLMNQLDFRPSVANTVAANSTPTDAPVNPPETITFNQTIDKKFPLPDGSCSITLEHYLGRIDDVYISNRGNIYVLQGIPAIDPKKRYQSNHPKDSLRLQTIEVPAYPSISQVISDNVADIAFTKIANEKSLNIRLNSHTTSPMMSSAVVQRTQPRVYTMEDIGNLERRIKDLEYYVALNTMETSITRKNIPSSTNPSINRFKFGFFADDFSSAVYSDTKNPQYSASIESDGDEAFGTVIPIKDTTIQQQVNNKQGTSEPSPVSINQKATNRITPRKHLWSIDHTDGAVIIMDNVPYFDELAIDQGYATTEPVIPPPVATPNAVPIIIEPNPCLITQEEIEVIETTPSTNGYYLSFDTDRKIREKIDLITFGTAAGKAILYFDFFGATDQAKIYQGQQENGNFTLLTTSNSAINLTNSDKLFLRNNEHKTNFYNVVRSSGDFRSFELIGNGFVKYTGKVEFNHNPTNGRYYKIVTTKGNDGSYLYKWLLSYPTNTSTSRKTLVNVERCGTINPPFSIFNGTMTVEAIKSAWSCSNAFRVNRVDYGAYIVNCTGLKPLTEHKFYIDGKEFTNVSPRFEGIFSQGNTFRITQTQVSTSFQGIGTPIITDAEGKVSFIVYVEAKSPLNIVTSNGDIDNLIKQITNRGTTFGSTGYSTLEVRDTNSVAKHVTPDRTPNKIMMNDPRGTI